jgi:diaminopimelate epimerase
MVWIMMPDKSPGKLMQVAKYQALGNSYLILDPRNSIEDDRSLASLAKRLCDVRSGIGSNGLLYGPIFHHGTAFGLRIVNSDGSRAGFSGNGVRIFARYLQDAGYLNGRLAIDVAVSDPEKKDAVNIVPIELEDQPSGLIRVTAPQRPSFGEDAVSANPSLVTLCTSSSPAGVDCYRVEPLAALGKKLFGGDAAWGSSTLVNIGNPHCVTFVDAKYFPTNEMLESIHNELMQIAFRPDQNVAEQRPFRYGANLQWVRVENSQSIEVAIFERGEGVTAASGSSASAAVSAAFGRGLVGKDVKVVMAGGSLLIDLKVESTGIKAVSLTGYADRILTAMVDI